MKQILYKTMRHFFPEYRQWLRDMKDPRKKNMTSYELPVMIWVGILLFLLKLGSKRQINYELDTEAMINNIKLLSREKLERIPYDGTLEYLLERLDPVELTRIREKMINRLIRNKSFSKCKINGSYPIAIDGSGYLTFKGYHCPHCLKKKKKGKVLFYYHSILEAKIISNGMAFSVETEFIENESEGVLKQDCELKAFYRLSEKLKKKFPQLEICLLLDSLYANKPVIDICNKNKWKYIITFKEGSMPEVYKEYETLKKINPDKHIEYNNNGIKQKFYWADNVLQYIGSLDVNVIECIEMKGNQQKRFVWLTNFSVDKYSVKDIAKGGRLRWKIENEGFNAQKNWGYNLEHPYSKHIVALKNFYLLLQIAHIINQLMENGSLLMEEIKKSFGSIKNFTKRLLESLRTSVFDMTEIQMMDTLKFQIRLRGP
ncbi:MAG: transposase [Elusimicrobia bacterium]|nr:transposase [Elusimicrobiota bacterium]